MTTRRDAAQEAANWRHKLRAAEKEITLLEAQILDLQREKVARAKLQVLQHENLDINDAVKALKILLE